MHPLHKFASLLLSSSASSSVVFVVVDEGDAPLVILVDDLFLHGGLDHNGL